MKFHFLVPLIVLASLSLALAGCGDDDDDSGGPTADPDTTEAPDGGDDTAPLDFGGERSGSGTIVIGDDTYEFEVTSCWDELIMGPGTTSDGDDFFGEVGATPLGDDLVMSASVAIGKTTLGQGDPHWQLASGVNLNPTIERNGELHISFSGQFQNTTDDDFSTFVEGSVDASCTP